MLQPIRSTTQISVVTRHQYGISALVLQTSFREEIGGDVANVRCFLRLCLVCDDKYSACSVLLSSAMLSPSPVGDEFIVSSSKAKNNTEDVR